MSDPQQPVAAPSTGSPHDETREHPRDHARAKLKVEAATPGELLKACAEAIGARYVVAGASWHELIYNVSEQAPHGELGRPIQAKLSHLAAVARQADL